MINAVDIRKGIILNVDGGLFMVADFQHATPGNKRGFVQVTLKNLKQGNTIQRKFRSTDKIEDIFLDHREMEYLYQDGNSYCFMDSENFEQVFLSKSDVESAMQYITPNIKVDMSFYEGKAIDINLPSSVVLKIVETEPGMKGNTVTNVFKPARLETGLVIKVPLFIDNDEFVKVDTRTGEFLGRA